MSILNTIINLGITEKTAFKERVRLRGLNIGLLTGILLVLSGMAIGNDSEVLLIFFSVLGLLFVVSLFLNSRSLITISRYILVVSVYIWLVTVSILFGESLGFEYYFFVALFSMLLFTTNNLWRIISAVIISMTLLSIKVYQHTHHPYYILPAYNNLFFAINIIFSCTLITILGWVLVDDIRKYESGILLGRKKLRQSNELKDRMFSIIGHDLRSPLNSLKGSLYLLDNNSLTKEEQTLVIKELNERLDKATSFLDSLLAWSSQTYFRSSEKTTLLTKPIDLYELVQKVLLFYTESAEKKEVQLLNKVAKNIIVTADYDQLLFVVRNLVGNALKFSSSKGEGVIEVGGVIKGKQIEIYVKDNGTGIKPEIMQNLFNIEKRQSTPGTMNEKGTGLGLIFCKEFIEMNGSSLHVESKWGNGAKFYFLLNRQQDD